MPRKEFVSVEQKRKDMDKDRRETIVQRRERVLVVTSRSGDKRRGQILQAQRIHRQRTLDYIEELENEIFRLRAVGASSQPNTTLQARHRGLEDTHRAQSQTECHITLHILIRFLNKQLGPGLFMRQAEFHGDSCWGASHRLDHDVIRSETLISLGSCNQYIDPSAGLDVHDALTQMLLLNFSENIAPTLVAFDGASNGFNGMLLPVAYSHKLLRDTILAASANHLRFKSPRLAKIAMQYQAAAIQTLTQATGTLPPDTGDDAVFTLAAIVVLIVNDMMNGGGDFSILFDMAKSWNLVIIESNAVHDLPLLAFLREQLETFEHVVQPLLTEKPFFLNHNNMYEIFSALESAVKQACAIYTYHTTCGNPPENIEALLKELKDTALLIPSNTPGESGLAWVYFIAAAKSASPLYRTFFARRLMGIHERRSFADVTTAFSVLQQIWDNWETGVKWMSSLSRMPLIFR
ncbi:uncharacterized protein LY89DRAFT_691450 [Mollisia scopiformis]|uniref:Uncharacterized protein n=1 Tax=Mollisia scopiformis TaxID=149040 RepID=A0A132B5U5_MOLSC|nr:uncharacterized protein LY89DRAFT_691450 [Mollisia scopiformis]KUJ07711.1 hypothetical protein LY89DRAFT_691450 [Mollisia scopiformis]